MVRPIIVERGFRVALSAAHPLLRSNRAPDPGDVRSVALNAGWTMTEETTPRADREHEVGLAFVSIASALVGEYDIADLYTTLTRSSVDLLDVSSAGLLLADPHGQLRLAAASSDPTRDLELFVLQSEQGPCLDCFRGDVAVSVADLGAEVARWPRFVPTALEAGFRSVHALPMHLRGVRLGTLGLFGTTVGSLDSPDLELGQALADVASVALVVNQTSVDRLRHTQQLQTALDSRVVLEQAKGQLAQVGTVSMESAFGALRLYARDHNERLSEVARKVVARELTGIQILAYASSKDVRADR